MSFTFHGAVGDDGSLNIDIVVPNGATVTNADVLQALALSGGVYAQRPLHARLMTLGEIKAAQDEFDARQKCPDGWEASNDGASVNMGADMQIQSRLKKYLRADGAVVELNVDANDVPLVGETDKLRAYDGENPPRALAEPPTTDTAEA